VWVGYPNALTEMRSVHGISVAGGTFPAQIWHDYMNVAKGSDCGSFPQPKDEVNYSGFLSKGGSGGRGSRSYDGSDGGAGDYYTAPAPSGPGDNSAGGQDYQGYDPRLYESPPQPEPQVEPLPEPEGDPGFDPGGQVVPDG